MEDLQQPGSTQDSADSPMQFQQMTADELRMQPDALRQLTEAFLSKPPGKLKEQPPAKVMPPRCMPTAMLLSTREIEVLQHYAKGLNRRQVADAMKLSFNTIGNMRHIMLHKCRCANIEELIQLARLEGVI